MNPNLRKRKSISGCLSSIVVAEIDKKISEKEKEEVKVSENRVIQPRVVMSDDKRMTSDFYDRFRFKIFHSF